VNVPTLEFEISDVEWQFLYATIWITIDSFDDKEQPKVLRSSSSSSTIPYVPSKKEKDGDDIHVNVKVGSAVLVTTMKGEKLGQFSIHDILVEVDLEDKTDALHVDGKIGSVLLRDVRSNAAPLYQTILSPKDKTKEMVLFKYESHGNKPHPLEDWDSAFTMQFRKIEMVAMVGFILTIKNLVLNPIFARLDLEAARAKAAAARIKAAIPAKLSSIHNPKQEI
jgi:hypothetical protein